MKQRFIAGNWKDKRQDLNEINEWVHEFKRIADSTGTDALQKVTIVVCAPFPYLTTLKELLEKYALPLVVGAQDVSEFRGDEKPVTGEVTARMLRSIGIEYVIIGHSERRNLGESDAVLQNKVEQARRENLKVIYCVPDATTVVPIDIAVVAYEPVWAIGSGKAEAAGQANEVITQIKKNTGVRIVIYGGSVTHENVAQYMRQPDIDGILPGGASLDAGKFFALIVNSAS
jgi:triosephosphate isomerase